MGNSFPVRGMQTRFTGRNQLTVYYQNVRGLRTKFNDVSVSVLAEVFDIICFTETWLNEDFDNCDIIDDRYIIFRQDRDYSTGMSRGGGVLIAAKRSLRPKFIVQCNHVAEYVFVSITLDNMEKIIFCVTYFPPGSGIDVYLHFFNFFTRFNLYDNIFICGDFNLPITGDFLNQLNLDLKTSELRAFMLLFNLKQLNAVPNCCSKYLDLILSNLHDSSIIVEHSDNPLTLEDSYHPALSVSLQHMYVRSNKQLRSTARYNFKKADFLSIWLLLSKIDWNFLNVFDDVNCAVTGLYNILNQIFDQTIPLKFNASKYPLWYSIDTLRIVKAKAKARKLALRNHDPVFIQNFKSLRSSLKISIASDYSRYIKDTENNLIRQPEKFWSYFKKSQTLPSEVFFNDANFDNDIDIANAFAKYFGSVYRQGTVSSPCNTSLVNLGDVIRIDYISHTDVVSAIQDLKSSLSTGVDNVPSFIVKGCAEHLIYPLLIIFNLSLKTCSFPNFWKNTKVIPVHKKGDVKNCQNYRPIAILSPFAKVFEIVIHRKIFSQVSGFIDVAQHGFFPHRSTLSNLYCLTSNIISAFETNCQLDVIYTDFTKAFDSLDFGIFLNKLSCMGFRADLVQWILSYLTDRSMYVYIRNSVSDSFVNCSGVPQGSNLGPLFFILFINDLCDSIKHSDFLLFADDLKIFRKILCDSDANLLQNDIDNIFNWCVKNKLDLNISKCCIVSYTRKSKPLLNSYNINSISLLRNSSVKDLGVIFNSNLDFSEHIQFITTKAYKILGFLKRKTTNFTSLKALKVLYFGLVRPNLEYCTPIWDPYYENTNRVIERVQNNFLRFLYFKSFHATSRDLPSGELRNLFEICTLKSRRQVYCLLFFYKALNNMIDSTYIIGTLKLNVPSRVTRSRSLFSLNSNNNNCILNFCLYKFYKYYNGVSDELDIFYMPFKVFKSNCQRLFSF